MRKITRTVVTKEIYEMIKEQILQHKLEPGEKINIDQLARELEVSNIPIRESLSRLAAEGLVMAVPYKGMFVTHMSLKELDDIFELRQSLEPLALRKAFHSLPKAEIQKVLKKWQNSTLPHDQSFKEALKIIAAMNEDVHGLYLDRCGNDTLYQMVHQFIERIQRYLLVLLPELQIDILSQEWKEHLEVLAALGEGDLEQALVSLEQHLNNSRIRTSALFEDSQH